MQPITNYVIIKAEKLIEDTVKKGNLELYLDGTYEPEENARIYGTVIAPPSRLNGIELYRKYRSSPEAWRYVSGFELSADKKMSGRDVFRKDYRPSDYSPEEDIVDISVLPIEIEEGDKAYFHFHALNDSIIDTIVEDGKTFTIHAIRYDQIFCVVRHIHQGIFLENEVETISYGVKTIIPIGGHVLIEPYLGEGEEIEVEGKTVKGSIGKFGIITDLHDKPVLYTGIVRHVCQPAAGYNVDFKPDDKILYSKHSDFENTIEGKKYYVMKIWDVVAKIE